MATQLYVELSQYHAIIIAHDLQPIVNFDWKFKEMEPTI